MQARSKKQSSCEGLQANKVEIAHNPQTGQSWSKEIWMQLEIDDEYFIVWWIERSRSALENSNYCMLKPVSPRERGQKISVSTYGIFCEQSCALSFTYYVWINVFRGEEYSMNILLTLNCHVSWRLCGENWKTVFGYQSQS